MDTSNHNKIDRKEAIKRTGMLMGGVIFGPSILGVLKGCTATPGVDWNPTLFSNRQAQLVTSLADVILPEDDTPSASQAGVPAFIESMVKEVYNDEQRETFLRGLDRFGEESTAELEADFFESPAGDMFDYVFNLNENALQGGPLEGETPFILMFKELTMLGYFTSEVGATQVLRYEAVPGRYDGCIPFEDVGRTWAT
ncbi:MAG: gluconate 2-dehydrogenase subunit 3 family protein [Balneolaceae bacterium]